MIVRLRWIVVLTVSALLASAGVLSSTVEATQVKSLFDENAARTHRYDNRGRSLRVTQAPDESENATGKKHSTVAEERISFTANIKLGFWETIGVSPATAKKWLGMPANVFGPALLNEKKFPQYLSYYNRIEKNEMWLHADRFVATTQYWANMEVELRRSINNLEDLKAAIKGTNAFRKYKRYAHTFDDKIVNVMGSGYHNPTNFGNDLKKAKAIEWWVRAEIWGEYKIDPYYVTTWMKNARLGESYYTHYKDAFDAAPVKLTLLGKEKADKAALKKFMLAEGSTM
ncbi:RxLR effector protein [Phytophthora megakarya]|uniref:RxLR effector protein n=1 Tax=Phytophthora megakarya TaxID=4795 RepID=A0A225WSS9_9STRA|nr:RxLR effector protein [Phytophthora megakarya]